MEDTRFFRAGAAKAAPEVITPEEAGIEPGGSLGSSLSYGDFSAVGIGTVTLVCGEDVVGFGHPMQWTGESSMTMHGADTVYVQEDPAWVPFKVANPTAPVGTIDNDRLVGISGFTGTAPDTTEIVSSARNSDTGFSRTGTTYASMPDFLPDLAALGIVANHTRVIDKAGPGGSLQEFTVTGTADGEPVHDDPGQPGLLALGHRLRVALRALLHDRAAAEQRLQRRRHRLDRRWTPSSTRTSSSSGRARWSVRTARRSVAPHRARATRSSAPAAAQVRLRVTLNPRSGASEGLTSTTRLLTVPVPSTLRPRQRGRDVPSAAGTSGSAVAAWPRRASRTCSPSWSRAPAPTRSPLSCTAGAGSGRVPPATSNPAPAVVTGGKFFMLIVR